MGTPAKLPSHWKPGLLHNRNFILLWCAYGISAMGDHISEMAILKTQNALDPTRDITPLIARMTFLFFVPFFLLAPLAGLLADRLPRRAVMISADAIRCVILLGFATLIGWTQGWGSWGPFMPLLAVGMFAALFSPARSALLPTLISSDQLIRANGLISGLGIIATMAAAKVGGYLADHYEPTVSFRVDAATFVASAVFLLMLRPPPMRERDPSGRALRSSLGELTAGFRYARTHRHVWELLVIAAIFWFSGSLVNSVIPAIVRDVYGGTYSDMSTYRALLGLGFIIGAVTITTLGNALRADVAITWGLMGIACGVGVFASSVFLPAAPSTLARIGAIGVVIAGMFGLAVMASLNSLLQRTVADRYRGRVFGVRDVCSTGALLLATGLLGVPQWTRLDRWVGPILVAVVLMTFVAGLITLRVRLRRGPHRPWLNFLFRLNEFVAKFWWRLHRIGRATIPRQGPVIITSNHVCAADPLFLIAAAPGRIISFLVAAEYVKLPFLSHCLRQVDCIPVRRGTRETGATKQALRHLTSGKAVAIFIEGGIVQPGKTARLKDGVALLALRTGAPVIPAYISGTVHRGGILRELLTRHRARVRFGRPVDLREFDGLESKRETVRAATRKIYAAIQALAPSETPVNEPPSESNP